MKRINVNGRSTLTYSIKIQFGQTWNKNLRWKFAKSVKQIVIVIVSYTENQRSNPKLNVVQYNTIYLCGPFSMKVLIEKDEKIMKLLTEKDNESFINIKI